MAVREVTQEMIDRVVNRRSFLTGLSLASAGVAAAAITGCSGTPSLMSVSAATSTDSAAQIFTAALIAEDLAITTYYNALTGAVITDPNLAGPGGTALNVTSGSQVNVAYLQGALLEEIAHAQLLRTLLNLSTSGSGDVGAGVPATFYYPTGTFTTLAGFLPVLIALETAFIGAYMTAVEEFASMAAGYNNFSATQANPAGGNYTQAQLINFAKVSASILGVEAEHRALARGIPAVTVSTPTFAGINMLPADNVNYESDAGLTGLITSVSGSTTTTAAAALGPFLTTSSSNSAGFSLATALAGSTALVQASVSANVTGSIPAAE